MPTDPRGLLRRSLRALVYVWLNVGVFLVLVALVELGCSLWLKLRPPADPFWGATTLRMKAEDDAPWVGPYQDELGDSFGHVDYEDFVAWGHKPESGQYINVDADGTRRTWNPPLPADAPEIWVFGGSTVWGFGERDDHTIPSELSRRLAAAGVAARVRNLGEWGFISTQELISLERELGEGHRPELVLFVDGLNDVSEPVWRPPVAGEQRTQRSRRLRLPTAAQALTTLYHRSSFYQALVLRVGATPPLPAEQLDATAQGIARVYAANIHAVEALGQKFGFPVLVYWQPNITRKAQLSPLEEQLKSVEPPIWGPGRALFPLAARAVHAQLDGDPAFHDIEDLFVDERGTIYSDNLHYTERAAARIAARLADDVVPLARTLPRHRTR